MTAPAVSAIVPARELTPRGRRCVERLLALDTPVEVIVVTDEPARDLDPRARNVVCAGPAGTKRQAGLEHCSAHVVALIDDDAYPHPSWLEAALATLDDPTIGAVCGPTLTPFGAPEPEALGGRVYESLLVSGPHRWRYVPLAERDVDDAPSANLVVRASVARTIGFDTPFHPGEDTIFCDKLRREGYRIRYSPDVVVFHDRRPLWRPHVRQVWRFARRRAVFARKVGGNSLQPSYFVPTAAVVTLAASPFVRAARLPAAVYVLACLAASADRDPQRWLRIAGGTVATHAAYGVGFLVGILGRSLPEERSR